VGPTLVAMATKFGLGAERGDLVAYQLVELFYSSNVAAALLLRLP